MELVYKGKASREAVIEKAEFMKESIAVESDRSLLIKGDCFVSMASIMKDFKGKIDLVYMDPPQNGFMSEGADRSRLKADDYAEFIRERVILAYELLSEKGSLYLHISSRDSHFIKLLCDEIFGERCFKNDITRIRSNPRNSASDSYGNEKDVILFYAKNPELTIWNDIRIPLEENEYSEKFNKFDSYGRRYATVPLHAPGETKSGATGDVWRGISAPKGRHWMTTPDELDRLDSEGRIEWSQSGNPRLIVYAAEYEGKRIQDVWTYKDPLNPEYAGEKNAEMLDLIIRQSTKKGSIVLDCFSGSGAVLYCAEARKRRFIGMDSSTDSINMIMKNTQKSLEYHDLFTGFSQTVAKEEAEQLSLFDDEEE